MITWIATSDLFGRGSQDRPQEVSHLFVLEKIPSLCFQTGEIDGWIDGLLLGMTHDPRETGPKDQRVWMILLHVADDPYYCRVTAVFTTHRSFSLK